MTRFSLCVTSGRRYAAVMMHVSYSPAGLLHSETDCRDRGFSHNALAGATRQLCQGQSPFVVQSWSIACPDRQCQIHLHLLPAEITVMLMVRGVQVNLKINKYTK